ncbi:MAG: hypothetical protein HY094_09605 [Candidatus Melainabacteria bacterium]|nr:hypothetical protein [Candidatus Melainabacteria bacterium]
MAKVTGIIEKTTLNPPFDKVGPNHPDHDGICSDSTCKEKISHNHWTDYGCLSCVKDYLEKIFPFEQKINTLKFSPTIKQLLLMASNLTPAIATSEVLKPLHVSSFIASPLAISAMHFANRGKDKLHKLFFTSLSSIGVLALQKFASLPRILTRPILATAVFFVERNNGKHESHTDHTHTEECNHDENKLKKSDLIKLLKIQGQINTVPWVINSLANKLKASNNESDNLITKFFGHVGISAIQIAGLSLGFVGLGKLIDKLLLKFNYINNEESLVMRAEGAVCACCGAPVCVVESTSEVASMAA